MLTIFAVIARDWAASALAPCARLGQRRDLRRAERSQRTHTGARCHVATAYFRRQAREPRTRAHFGPELGGATVENNRLKLASVGVFARIAALVAIAVRLFTAILGPAITIVVAG